MQSGDGGRSWSEPIRAPLFTPHGPIRLRNGQLLCLGKDRGGRGDEMPITAAASVDGGRTWEIRGEVPLYPGTRAASYFEPHAVELPDGRLLGMIRIEDDAYALHGEEPDAVTKAGLVTFSMMQTMSADHGAHWSTPRPLGFHGSPPHLLRHSSGTLVLTYGYRQAPFGTRVAFSHDEGATWDHDWILRDDGTDGDVGYPSTVELGDGRLFTVCYQKVPGDAKNCSLLWSRWSLP